jgi:hypothetical protein
MLVVSLTFIGVVPLSSSLHAEALAGAAFTAAFVVSAGFCAETEATKKAANKAAEKLEKNRVLRIMYCRSRK